LSSAWCALTVFHAAASRLAKKGSPINQITGPASGATPNAAEIKANAIRMIEAQTPKAMSEEFSRVEVEAPLFRGRSDVVDAVSRVAMGGYKTVGEKKAISISKSIRSNQ
jgi:dihydropteroate synthase